MIRTWAAAGMALALAACGGGGGHDGPEEEEPAPADPLLAEFGALEADFAALAAGLGALAPTAEAPTVGTGTYKGTAELALGAGGEAALLYGEARVRVDFEDGEMSGRLTDFVGRAGDGPVAAWEGRIGIDDGEDRFESLAAGTLTAGGRRIDLEAEMAGGLLGADAGGVGLGSAPGRAEARLDGAALPATLSVWAEEVWRSDP